MKRLIRVSSGLAVAAAIPLVAFSAISGMPIPVNYTDSLLILFAYLLVERFALRLRVGEFHLNFVATELPAVLGLLFLPIGPHLVVRFLAGALGTLWRRRGDTTLPRLTVASANGILGAVEVAILTSALVLSGWDGELTLTTSLILVGATIAQAAFFQANNALARKICKIELNLAAVLDDLANSTTLSVISMCASLLLFMSISAPQFLVIIVGCLAAIHPTRKITRLLTTADQYRSLDKFFSLLQQSDSSNVDEALELARQATKSRDVTLVILEREGLDHQLESALSISGSKRESGPLSQLPVGWRNVLSSSETRVHRDTSNQKQHDEIVCPLIVSGHTVGLLVCADQLDPARRIGENTVATATRIAQHLSMWLEQDRLMTELRREMVERTHQALHDPLTGLLNRRGLSEAWDDEALNENQTKALFLVDLDSFKAVNTHIGHDGGDRVLMEVAQRLRAALPPRAHIARLGGDEFAVLIAGVRGGTKDVESAGELGVIMRNALAQAHRVNNEDLQVGGSVGVSVAPLHGNDLATLMRNADAALFVAKDDTESGVSVFATASFGHEAQLVDSYRLKTAIANGDIQPYYQPIIDMQTCRIAGFEALARWDDNGTMIMPNQFIPLAEKSGHIQPMTELVMRVAFVQTREWQELTGRDLYIGVNVSPVSIAHPDTLRALNDALRHSGIDPACVHVEVTESRMFKDPMRATAHLQRLRETGVQISLDDFGTGHSSHEWLVRMAPNQLKIDRLFVRDINDPRAAGIIDVDVMIAKKFGMSIVAEGIETADQWRRLKQLGVGLGQGYLLGRPKPAALTTEWIMNEEPTLGHLLNLAESLDPESGHLTPRRR